ncbi:unnamed protein product [Allacma fusca]|uniref:Carboxypeptidase n=1 Tax=Allacma fusca TaxID=39272 RepID=A0A8J2Q081_9HEXA|nr:unnamed protein product [Allacma fusca]
MALFTYVQNVVTFLASQISAAPADGELFLTPFIKNGELDKARALSEDNMKVSNIKSEKEIKSYSGYLTIDEKTNSNLFFWFFPAQENPDNAPVLLWINELPGFSCVRAIFLETGPFKVGPNNLVSERNTSWTRSHSMLYVDSPVGTGFSFSDSDQPYETSSAKEGTEMYEALKQFFTIFKEFQPREFYLAGENYAASLIPNIVKRIESENANGDFKINVKGFILGSPYLDVQQLHKAQALYDFGLIDMDQKKMMEETTKISIEMIENGQIKEGTALGLKNYVGPDSLIAKFTGFEDYFNILVSKPPPEGIWFQNFIDSKEVHNYLHVGLHKYVGANFGVLEHFTKELSTYHGEIYEDMLNKGYRVLIYASQFNLFNPQSGVTEVVNKLKWNGAEKFSKAERKIWKVNDDIAGYVKKADNFVYAIVRNSGHYAIMDQPGWLLDLIETFLYNREF